MNNTMKTYQYKDVLSDPCKYMGFRVDTDIDFEITTRKGTLVAHNGDYVLFNPVDDEAKVLSEEELIEHYDEVKNVISQKTPNENPILKVVYNEDMTMAECPICGFEYEDTDGIWGEMYCPRCGQRLSWDEDFDDYETEMDLDEDDFDEFF